MSTANTITYVAAIGACEKGRQRQHALELFARKLGERTLRHTIALDATISAYEEGRQLP